jgi:hypothetical protein
MQDVSVDDSGKGDTCDLAAMRLGEEILVLREEGTPQFGSPIKNLGIGEPTSAIGLDRQRIDTSKAKAVGNGPMDLLVKIERDAQAAATLVFRQGVRLRLFSRDTLLSARGHLIEPAGKIASN